jgi:ABC-type branched-subunit amino acid transport system substrate-binding protein
VTRLVVVGPTLTTASPAAGPIYGQAGIAAIAGTAHGDNVTASPTMFRPIFSTSEMGASIAVYVDRILHGKQAIVLFEENGFGQPLADGFQTAAARIGIAVTTRGFTTAADGEAAGRQAAADPAHPVIVLASLGDNAARVPMALRRANVQGPIIGPDAVGVDSFAALFANEPEERRQPGFFTEGVYAASAMILDSANAETLAVADRFHRRFGSEFSWVSMQGYDSARLAIAALRDTANAGNAGDKRARRDTVRARLAAFDSPEPALPGLTGPRWFTPDRGRVEEIRFRGRSRRTGTTDCRGVGVPQPDTVAGIGR